MALSIQLYLYQLLKKDSTAVAHERFFGVTILNETLNVSEVSRAVSNQTKNKMSSANIETSNKFERNQPCILRTLRCFAYVAFPQSFTDDILP